jgi:hypothetical protein
MKVFIVINTTGGAFDNIDVVFSKREDAENYREESNQCILEFEVIE